jgi:L-threonylcarbamoyladenylate synthase
MPLARLSTETVPDRADVSGAPLDAVVGALKRGEVVGIPTDTVYGLAVDPSVAGAASRLFAAKGRPETVPLPVLVADAKQLFALARELSPEARALAERYWPGPLTLVLRRSPKAAHLELGGDPGTIGLRCPENEVALALLRDAGPLAVTSANRHGEPPLHTAAEVRDAFGEALAGVVDGGRCDGTPSSVVRVTGGRLELIRAGAIPFEDLEACAGAG